MVKTNDQKLLRNPTQIGGQHIGYLIFMQIFDNAQRKLH